MFVSKPSPKLDLDMLKAAAPASADRRTFVLALICSWLASLVDRGSESYHVPSACAVREAIYERTRQACRWIYRQGLGTARFSTPAE